MIVDNLDVYRSGGPRRPFETYPPLLVDADRMLSCSVSLQGFKTIAWKPGEIGKVEGGVKYFEPLPALPVKTLERPHELAFGEKLGALVPEGQDHAVSNLAVFTMYVKRKYSGLRDDLALDDSRAMISAQATTDAAPAPEAA
jgi:hypothetical protein